MLATDKLVTDTEAREGWKTIPGLFLAPLADVNTQMSTVL
jgi:hypothetical protein